MAGCRAAQKCSAAGRCGRVSFIPYGRQHITDEDIAAVVEVLKSDYLTQGPAIEAFEKALCQET
ncbi:MAG TPA: DegT/DnrJ/EryC1/StrS family aminotransferase, partial [Candidatus Rifleibacterium sp.]|nr:DegT/DnrJ/EryC1/StrS family aminotransferase [Candidatus Rifleibacterium sp.]